MFSVFFLHVFDFSGRVSTNWFPNKTTEKRIEILLRYEVCASALKRFKKAKNFVSGDFNKFLVWQRPHVALVLIKNPQKPHNIYVYKQDKGRIAE